MEFSSAYEKYIYASEKLQDEIDESFYASDLQDFSIFLPIYFDEKTAE